MVPATRRSKMVGSSPGWKTCCEVVQAQVVGEGGEARTVAVVERREVGRSVEVGCVDILAHGQQGAMRDAEVASQLEGPRVVREDQRGVPASSAAIVPWMRVPKAKS